LSDGSLLLQPLTNQIDVIDTNSGLLRHRISLPVTIGNVFDATVLDEDDNALFAITSSGIAEIPLDQLPLASGVATPSEIGTAGGTITLSGTGFVPGTEVSIDGKPVPTTFVDRRTLRFVAPPSDARAATIAIVNPAGQSIMAQSVLAYSVTPRSAKESSVAGGNLIHRRPSVAMPTCRPPLAGSRQAPCGSARVAIQK
jgi:hypothetical protein